MSDSSSSSGGIALVALAGRFPGADSVEEFWNRLCAGAECIRRFTPEELAASGAPIVSDPNHVPTRGVVEKADWFDAAFFGYTPREAELIDPQHRVFLECAAEALERAGCDPQRYEGLIGVFGGASLNTYAVNHLYSYPKYRAAAGSHQLGLANEKDYLTARVSYKLNLRGPSVNVQTACATSLTAVCIACQSLLSHQCDLALAGGASLLFPQTQGYVHQPGGIFSPDGHCRTFDAEARGTVPGDGVAVVALKRLADAQADGDRIYAVIKGFAFGNDGALKVGFAAPSADGQMETVMLAQGMAGVDPSTIGYVEAHGTATVLGDPIEMESLTQAFRAGTDRKNFCAIGSVKSNIGHLDAAAGAAGLIKAALALHHRRIPPSLHFKSPNPRIDFAESAFYVADRLIDWSAASSPRRAGVNSMGMGGTNVHVVLEEAPPEPASASSRSAQVLPFSAKTPTALDRAAANLAAWLGENPGLSLADVAWTLQTGRREFACRRTVVARDLAEAVAALRLPAAAAAPIAHDDGRVAFLFTGQGAQKVNMGRGLYEREPVFRAEVDRCAGLLRLWLGFDLRTVLYPPAGGEEAAQAELDQTRLTQPALFVFEYALARLWMSWGVTPTALLGHSLGEYVAACLAGVFSLEDALGLVATRARLMQEQPAGTMLAVRLPEAELRPSLPPELCIATINSVNTCVVAGPAEAVTALEKALAERGVGCKRLRTSHAFHSAMMEPALTPFAAAVAKVRRSAPAIPVVSNVTGTWLTAEQATSPDYWASHIREAVRFADGVGVLAEQPGRVFLEVGPGATLAGLARQHPAAGAAGVVASLPGTSEKIPEPDAALRALGELWLAGVRVDWGRFHAGERRRRVLLPTYPFERQRHCIEPAPQAENPAAVSAPMAPADCIVAVEVKTAPRDDSVLGRLTALFSEVSGVDLARQAEASFASLGFDSLLLAQATAAIKRQFGVTILFGDLLGKLGTLREVAGFVEASAAVPVAAAESAPEAAARPAPPTDAQREIWLASQVSEAASCAYNETRRLRFRGPLRRAALHAALQRLVDRHDALRTTFSPDGGEQRTALRLTLAMPDASGTADEVARTEAETPFDLENGPLIRARLLSLGEEDHVLFVTIHHLVCDGQAWGILLQELAEQYRGGAALPSPPLQIGDYARILATRAAGEEGEAAQAYWCRRFADGVPAFELPADHPRPARRNFEGGREDRVLPAGLRDRLRALGAARNCTFFHTMLAVFYVWLRRLSGETDIVIGVPVAERSPEGADRLVAHCIDFMPVRLSGGGADAFEEFLVRTKDVFMEALAHRQCSFGRIVRALDLPYDPGRHPLTTVTFNVSRMRESLDFGELSVEAEASRVSSIAFDLSFNVVETGDELRLDCRYSRTLFEAATIRRWLGHFETLLVALAAEPVCAVDRLPLLSEAERRQILADWNATAADYPRDCTVHALFAEQAARAPEAVAAIYDGGRTLGYGELDRRANQLAHHLRRLGVGPGRLVGFCLERSPEMLVALLAILKAGGAYVSFDPTYPPARLASMAEDAHPVAMLTTLALRRRLPEGAAPCLCFDGPEFAAVAEEDGRKSPDDAETGPESLAYVCFTSGSTGRPKGVCVPHRGVVRLVRGANYARFGPDEVFLQFAPVAFDASTFEIWGALLNGARLVLFPTHAPTLAELGETIQRHGVTTLWLSAGLFQQVVEERCDCLKGVSQLLAGGDVLSPPHVRKVLEQFPGCRLINGYGPTENTTFTCCHPITEKAAGRRAIPIGRPIANTRVYVLDERMQPVPIGVPGELYAGGDGLAQGYLNRPELTAEKFVPDPFGDDPAARLYKTGDRVRWLADGSIDFLGRIDSQVKIRGFRVELDEIENALGRYPGLRACAVVAQAAENGDKRLVACLVAVSSPPPEPAELRRFLSGSLPDYMVPTEAGFVFLDALPLDPNGKVDRRALASGAPAIRPVAAAPRGRAAPRDAVERQLVEIWEEILGVSPVGLNDRFFELGGHSLLAMRLLERIEKQFARRLPLAAVFEAPSAGELAALIRGHDFSARSSLVEIKAEGSKPPLFLVHGVGGGMFWGYANLARHLGPDQPVYAFKSRGLDGEEEFDTIEEMAAAYVADLRAFQPQGPYLLGGYCFGGNVACEMARRLRAEGEEVGLLVLMNCVPHGGSYGRGRATPAWLGRYLMNLYGLVAQLHASGPEAKRAYFRWKWGAIKQRVRRWLGRPGEQAPEFEVGETVDLAAYSGEQRRLWAAHVRALCRYRIQPFDGRVVLLRSRLHQHYCSFAQDCGWGEFARGGVEVSIVPGAHESILEEPHVGMLAEQLRACLERRSLEEQESAKAENFRAAELAVARA